MEILGWWAEKKGELSEAPRFLTRIKKWRFFQQFT